MKIFLIALLITAACGVPLAQNRKNRNRITKIIGGSNAIPGQFPYQVSLRDTSFGANFHFCGGSVYNKKTILDAAHCVEGENYNNQKNLQIVAGDINIGGEVSSPSMQIRDVTSIVIHEDYDSTWLSNDISLLTIDPPLTFDDNVKPITLPDPSATYDAGKLLTVTGWGTVTNGQSEIPDILQYVDVPVVSDAECSYAYRTYESASMICAGKEGKDSCQGDSGGPLVDMSTGSFVQVGIVSWGRKCGVAGYPGVYTRVSHFVDWINNT